MSLGIKVYMVMICGYDTSVTQFKLIQGNVLIISEHTINKIVT